MPDAHDNPLLQPWNSPLGLPPFAAIRADHFAAAFDQAMAGQRDEIEVIRNNEDPPSFANTIAALDRSGRLLDRINRLFFNLAASETSPELQTVERLMAPRLAAHHSAIHLDAGLFARIDALHRQCATLGLAPEERRLLARVHLDFVRAGAALAPPARARLAAINEQLAELDTRFSQNLLADEGALALALHDPSELDGLPEALRGAAQAAANERGLAQAWAITLSRSLLVPFLTCSTRRDLREAAWRAWTRRGENAGDHDNRPVMREILALRHELAQLHGYRCYADYALVDRMAGTPAAVTELLAAVWQPARANAAAECDRLGAMARSRGVTEPIEAWDWRYWAEQTRAAQIGFDDDALKPYLSLDRMQAAAFDTAKRLFGIDFIPRPDVATYHPDVRVFEVRDAQRGLVGTFLADHFARPTKRSGAWMSSYRAQSRSAGDTLPVIVNNNNFAKAPDGGPTLLSVDDVRTLFHEFGHGLHGLLSDVTYERLAGTEVLADFVELPSQLFEHWAFEDSVLARHACHHATGAPMPPTLLAKFRAARHWNKGFETVEYAASALVDMALHGQPDAVTDGVAFEQDELGRIGMPPEIVPRHRLPHFGHLFSGSAYAAGYYVYLWAEVLAADAYDAFTERGDPFDAAVASRLRRHIYASGATLDPADAFRAFRGRDPRIGPMLANRGLVATAAAAHRDSPLPLV
jgi:peptidyl-dipeptidase Dcp